MNSLKRLCGVLMAASVLFTLGCAASSTHESTGQVIDDSAITTKVKKAIYDEPSLKVAQIKVETFKSVVQLSGWVDSSAQIGTAASVARSVDGVVSVKNDLRLKY
jgi:osmotically-inducible protein OsmY